MSNRALFAERSPGDIEAARGGDREARLRLLHDFAWELRDGEPLSPDLREYFATVLGSLSAAAKLTEGECLSPQQRSYCETVLAGGKEPPDLALGLRRPRGRRKPKGWEAGWVSGVIRERLALRAYDAAIKKGESHTKALEYAEIETEELGMRIPKSTLARLVEASGRRS
jgi:hypothetical protein